MTPENKIALAAIIVGTVTQLVAAVLPVIIKRRKKLRRKPQTTQFSFRSLLNRSVFELALGLDQWLMRHRLAFFILGLLSSGLMVGLGVFVGRRGLNTVSVVLIAYGVSLYNVCFTSWNHFQLVEKHNRLVEKVKTLSIKVDV
jgi:hypothetical protein